jgi:hypothetical protein
VFNTLFFRKSYRFWDMWKNNAHPDRPQTTVWRTRMTCCITKFTNAHSKRVILCLETTNKCMNSYQFIISLSCSYMFRQLCAILSELVCTFWVTCQFGFFVDKILCSMWLCVYYVAAWPVSICLSMLPSTRQHRQTTKNFINRIHRILSTKNPNGM